MILGIRRRLIQNPDWLSIQPQVLPPKPQILDPRDVFIAMIILEEEIQRGRHSPKVTGDGDFNYRSQRRCVQGEMEGLGWPS